MYPAVLWGKDFLPTENSVPNNISKEMRVKRLTNVSLSCREVSVLCHFHAVYYLPKLHERYNEPFMYQSVSFNNY